MKLLVLRLILILVVLLEIVNLNATCNIAYNPVDIVCSKEFNEYETTFKVFQSDHRGKSIEVESSPDNLTKKWFAKEFMDQFVSSATNIIKIGLRMNEISIILERKEDLKHHH